MFEKQIVKITYRKDRKMKVEKAQLNKFYIKNNRRTLTKNKKIIRLLE